MQKIAIVDDAADNRDFLNYMLRDEYHVRIYESDKQVVSTPVDEAFLTTPSPFFVARRTEVAGISSTSCTAAYRRRLGNLVPTVRSCTMKNRILKGLPPREHRILSPQLKPVVLKKGSVLYEAGERITQVYFPETSMISYLSGTSEGDTIEVGVVGNEGVAGLAALLSDSTAFRAVVQIPGNAYSLNQELLRREFKR